MPRALSSLNSEGSCFSCPRLCRNSEVAMNNYYEAEESQEWDLYKQIDLLVRRTMDLAIRLVLFWDWWAAYSRLS